MGLRDKVNALLQITLYCSKTHQQRAFIEFIEAAPRWLNLHLIISLVIITARISARCHKGGADTSPDKSCERKKRYLPALPATACRPPVHLSLCAGA